MRQISSSKAAGTSAGSIVGALVAAGMRSSRITDIITTLDYRRFADRSLLDRVPIGGPLLSLLKDEGVFEGDQLRGWLGNLLVDECGVETFGDLAIDDPHTSLPPQRRFRLVVTATDVTRGELVYFPWDYERYGLEPRRQRVADAVRVLPHLPMEAAKLLPIAGLFKHGPVALAANLAMTTVVGRDQAHLAKPWVKVRTMQVDSAGVNPIDFGLSRAQATTLFKNGRAAATRFLTDWDWENYLVTFRGVTRHTA